MTYQDHVDAITYRRGITMLAVYKFATASGHTIEATRTATGYDVHTRNAEGESISTVAQTTLQAAQLIAALLDPGPAPSKRTAAKRKANR